jgi:hypothetical protein
MIKKLMFILAIALLASITVAAYAEVQNVKVGGDIYVIGINRYRFDLTKHNNAVNNTHNGDLWGTVTRVRIDADLTDNVSTTVRVLNERVWATLGETTDNTDIDLDLALVTLKEFLFEPVTMVIGRQPLKLGDGLLVADPYTNQTGSAISAFPSGFRGLSQRRAFDGIVAVLDYAPVKVTGGFVKGLSGYTNLTNNNADADVYALNIIAKDPILKITPEFTYVLKDFKKTVNGVGQVNNYSIRLTSAPIKDLKTRGEFVYQTQKNCVARASDRKSMSDTAFTAGVDYVLSGVKMKPTLGMDYMRLSQNWDRMYESIVTGDIINGLFANTNQQVIGFNVGMKPADDFTVKFRYANARAVKAYNDTTLLAWGSTTTCYDMTDKKDLGNEFDVNLIYDYTEDVQFGFKVGYFNPGTAFDGANDEYASQVVGTMKVTF